MRLRQAREAVLEHDVACGECDIRRRVRCAEGHALIRVLWAADGDVAAESARTRQPDPGPTLFDMGWLSMAAPASAASLAAGQPGQAARSNAG